MSVKNALVVDDTAANRDFLERLLTAAGFETHGADSATTALDLAKPWETLKLAVIDMELPDINGIQLTGMLRQRFPNAYIVVATMHDDVSLIESVFLKGANAFLVKPHGFMELFKRLTTIDLSILCEGDCTVIDQYGPRTYHLEDKTKTQTQTVVAVSNTAKIQSSH